MFAGISVLLVILAVLSLNAQKETATQLLSACPDAGDITCVRTQIERIVREDGLQEALREIEQLYRAAPAFRPFCHETAMYLGFTASSSPSQNIFVSAELAACNYGFLQEYTRARLRNTGDIQEMKNFCTSLGTQLASVVPDAGAECFRGVGRALPFISAQNENGIERAIDVAAARCREFAPQSGRSYPFCLSGIFNGVMREVRRAGLELPDTERPLSLCETLSSELRARCFGNLKWLVVTSTASENISDVYEEFTGADIPSDEQAAVIWTFGYDAARRYTAEDAPFKSDCHSIPAPFSLDCIRGFAIGIVKHGTPDEQDTQLFDFCAASPEEDERRECAKDALIYLQGRYAPERFAETCSLARTELGIDCLTLK